jgi:hypothetical protein
MAVFNGVAIFLEKSSHAERLKNGFKISLRFVLFEIFLQIADLRLYGKPNLPLIYRLLK